MMVWWWRFTVLSLSGDTLVETQAVGAKNTDAVISSSAGFTPEFLSNHRNN